MESTTLNGILSIMRSCSKANTVKRFVYTSSTGTITVQAQPPLHEYTEDLWTDVDLCYELKMYGWVSFFQSFLYNTYAGVFQLSTV